MAEQAAVPVKRAVHSVEPESLYRELGQLVAEAPDLTGPGPISAAVHRWLGRVAAVLSDATDSRDTLAVMDRIQFNTAADGLSSELMRASYAHSIIAILHRALARAERKAPASAQGAFIPVGAAFDVFQVIGKVLSAAANNALIVDAYMVPNVLIDFAPLAPEKVVVRLLTDSFYTKPETLRPAASRWKQQHVATRPLEIRLTAPRLLHDRLIVIDGTLVWSLTQSIKDFASRSPASVLRVDGDIAAHKIHAYGQLWDSAQPL